MKNETERTYIVYDGRANYDVDAASVCCFAYTLQEAKQDVEEIFPDGVIFSYIEKNGKLVDEKREY